MFEITEEIGSDGARTFHVLCRGYSVREFSSRLDAAAFCRLLGMLTGRPEWGPMRETTPFMRITQIICTEETGPAGLILLDGTQTMLSEISEPTTRQSALVMRNVSYLSAKIADILEALNGDRDHA